MWSLVRLLRLGLSGITPDEREAMPWRLGVPFAFGFVGPTLMMAVHAWWLGAWSDFGEEASIFAVLIWVLPVGLAFWYLAGLAWHGMAGCAGPAFGALLLILVVLSTAFDEAVMGSSEVMAGGAIAAVLGVVAYPFGVLARALFTRMHVLGAAWGAGLLGLCALGTVGAPTSGEFWTVGAATWLAPACFVAGLGTLGAVACFARCPSTSWRPTEPP